jgi:hypothetical protein
MTSVRAAWSVVGIVFIQALCIAENAQASLVEMR